MPRHMTYPDSINCALCSSMLAFILSPRIDDDNSSCHHAKGVAHYTHVGADHHFREFISCLSARERELFRFPPAGHPYYTPQTLEALEEQYPGWNAEGEYE